MGTRYPSDGSTARRVYTAPLRRLIVAAAAIASGLAAAPAGAVTNVLQTVAPASAAQGAAGVVVTFTLSATPPAPPTNVALVSASLGGIAGSALARPSSSTVQATFTIPAAQPTGSVDVTIRYAGSFAAFKAGGFTITPSTNPPAEPVADGAYPIVDTAQAICYGDAGAIAPPAAGQPFYGQDAQCQGRQPAYRDNGDGTVSDLATGLMWVRARGAKMAWTSAVANADSCAVGGYGDWRFPTIKELYSLILFSGVNGTSLTNSAGYVPFIATNYFGFAYGSGTGSERVIDCQDWSATPYVSTTMGGDATVFGVNFADGRIKGYPRDVPGSGGATPNSLYVRYVRGNAGYGQNRYTDNGDGTVLDRATGLMWSRADSGAGMNWSNALAWVQARNAASAFGYADWRLPNAKELQSIVDYSRAPDTTGSASIDPVFSCTPITNEAGAIDYPFYWTGTTLLDGTPTASGVYVCFGRAMGYMNGGWLDVHGAGAQRSDFKAGNPADYPTGRGPQGDAVRIYNYVRLVRDAPPSAAWRFAFVGDTHVPLTDIAGEIAAAAVSDRVDLVIVAGDLVEAGKASSAAALQSQLSAWRAAMAPAYDAGIGVYAVRGNHENDVSNNTAAWNAVFAGIYAMPTNGPAGEGNLTYSFAHSNALFVGLDHYASIHRVNQAWLDAQLAVNSRPHVFVFGHEPAFKAFHTDCLGTEPDARNAFWRSISKAGARVYLCGHDHLFNAARVDDSDGTESNDLIQFVVGTGGSTNWPRQAYAYDGTNAPYVPVNLTNVTGTYGYLLVEISGAGTNDRDVTLTWKQRVYDTNTSAATYQPASSPIRYTAADRLAASAGDGIPDWWRAWHFGGTGTSTNGLSAGAADPDGDGLSNMQEYAGDTDPTNRESRLEVKRLSTDAEACRIEWSGGMSAWQQVQSRESLAPATGTWSTVATFPPPTPATNSGVYSAGPTTLLYRVKAWR